MKFIIPNIYKSIQRDSYSCGVHSVKSIIRYCDKSYSLKFIKRLLNTTVEKGTNQTSIENFFRKIGIRYKINTSASLKNIEEELVQMRPVLITVDDCEHWVVIYGYTNSYFYVLDSANYICNKRILKKRLNKWWDHWMMSIKNMEKNN